MQTNKTLMRLIAAVMTVVMMLTAIPFTTFAADDSTDYVVFGTADGKDVTWRVLEKKADGSLVLITKDIVGAKVKYNSTAVFPDYANCSIKEVVESAITLTDAQAASLADTTMVYAASDNGTKVEKTLTVKFALPTMADFANYALAKASSVYYLADAVASSATNKMVQVVNAQGKTGTMNTTMAQNIRVMVTIKADAYSELPAVDGVTYTAADGTTAIKYAVAGASIKLKLDEAYSQSAPVVKFGGVEATATDGVYTVGTGAMTVEGVEVNPADYTAYDAAVAKTEGLVAEHYTEETWAALEAALAADVADLTAADQAKIDAAAKAIEDAFAALEALPADLEAYKAAVKAARELQASTLHNLSASPEGENRAFNTLINLQLRDESKILAYTIDKQAEVDAATKALNDLCAQVPYKGASLEKWTNAVKGARALDPKMYDPAYVAEVNAAVDAIVAEKDFEAIKDTLDIRDQEAIDAAAARISALFADKDSHFIQTDFSALEAALERAAGYAEENFYKDEDVKREEEVGGTAAWTNFADKLAAAQNYMDNKDKYTTAFSSQSYIDTATAQLVEAMDKLDGFVRLGNWDRFVKDVEWFFYDVKYQIDGIIALLQTVFGLLGMLFRGEIDLYGLLEMLDVGEDVLNFLIKIGIKPKDYIDPGADPENPDAPEATA
ncbi:MAG: hypothetical protein IKK09_06365 [Clostridia bacterium]|nr:hypothetical protein [Clostridia bacterium]